MLLPGIGPSMRAYQSCRCVRLGGEQGQRRQEGELVPQQGCLVVPNGHIESGPAQLGGQRFDALPRCGVAGHLDSRERAGVVDVPGRGVGRFDPDGRGDHLCGRIPLTRPLKELGAA